MSWECSQLWGFVLDQGVSEGCFKNKRTFMLELSWSLCTGNESSVKWALFNICVCHKTGTCTSASIERMHVDLMSSWFFWDYRHCLIAGVVELMNSNSHLKSEQEHLFWPGIQAHIKSCKELTSNFPVYGLIHDKKTACCWSVCFCALLGAVCLPLLHVRVLCTFQQQ